VAEAPVDPRDVEAGDLVAGPQRVVSPVADVIRVVIALAVDADDQASVEGVVGLV